jgi:glycosyltransferase 2 family protein
MTAHAAGSVATISATGARGVRARGLRGGIPMLVRWGGTLLLIGLVLALIDVGELAAILGGARPGLVLAVIGVALLERVISTHRWWLLLRAKGMTVRFRSLFSLHMAASFAGSFLPSTLGPDALRIAMIARRTGRPVDCIAASVVDRIMMVLGTMIAAAIAVMAAAMIAGAAHLSAGHQWYVVGAAAAACAATLLAANRRAMRLVGRISREIFGRRIAELFARIYWGMYEYRGQYALLAQCAAITVVVLIVRVAYTWLAAMALGVDVSFAALLVVLPIAWVIVMLPISVGGLGLQEGAFVVLLGLAGVPAAAAVAVSLLEQITNRLATAPGLVFWAAEPKTEGDDPGRDVLPRGSNADNGTGTSDGEERDGAHT